MTRRQPGMPKGKPEPRPGPPYEEVNPPIWDDECERRATTPPPSGVRVVRIPGVKSIAEARADAEREGRLRLTKPPAEPSPADRPAGTTPG
jgi:hypothetical protein